jgi:hypothetical protein
MDLGAEVGAMDLGAEVLNAGRPLLPPLHSSHPAAPSRTHAAAAPYRARSHAASPALTPPRRPSRSVGPPALAALPGQPSPPPASPAPAARPGSSPPARPVCSPLASRPRRRPLRPARHSTPGALPGPLLGRPPALTTPARRSRRPAVPGNALHHPVTRSPSFIYL